MKYSQIFAKTTRNTAKDEVTANADLLTRAGYVDKLMAGAYSYLPLGLGVLRNIEAVVRDEMNAVGGQEVLMAMLHPKANWTTTGGWDNIDVLFKVRSRTEKDYALGQSEEEVVTPLVMSRVNTYQDLPIAAYQIHWKFRDELRSKSGLLRGREFLMKDMYSFHQDQADFDRFYEIVKQAYLKIYTRLGLVVKVTEASGGAFSDKVSYEFMVLTDAGEDDILYCDGCEFCVNVEITDLKESGTCPKCNNSLLAKARASEVGNVFDLGQKYGKDFDLSFQAEDGSRQYPIMGCYGIGISRLMGVIVEKFHDDRGIIWPKTVAPAHVHLVSLGVGEQVYKEAETLYDQFLKQGTKVIWDDREVSAGVKLADADLIGLPYRVIISDRSLAGNQVEYKERAADDSQMIGLNEIQVKLSELINA